ncbi:MAG: YHS domain-containing (seleno)protein [Brachymonas sp.]
MNSRQFLHILAASALSLSSLSVQAQNYPASPNNGPWRTSTQDGQANVMLEGYDAVAYFTQNEAVRGNSAITLEHQGVIWRFASEANKAEFQKSPEKYMPQFGGFCSNGINYAVPWGGGGAPNSWRIYRGKLYVFGGQKARDHFEMDTELNLQRAHQYWNEEVSGSNAVIKRYQRIIFRVPHYKTDAALQSEFESKLASKTLPVMPGAAQVVPR